MSNNSGLEATKVNRAEEYEQLVYTHQCGPAEKPEWCVWGRDPLGWHGVIFYIRPSEKDEWAARRIAKYLNDNGRKASVEMTEWNPNLRGDPIYGKKHTSEQAA